MKSESIKEITAALSKAQIAFLPIKRTEKVDYQTTAGRKKYNYASLDMVIDATKQALSANGLAVIQSTLLRDSSIILETLLSHSSGEWLSSELYVGKQDLAPQNLGSALTYMRRYGLSAILCVSSEEDDDARGSSDKGQELKPTVKPIHSVQQVAKEMAEASASTPEKSTPEASAREFSLQAESGRGPRALDEQPPLIDPSWLQESQLKAHFPDATAISWLRSKANYRGLDFTGSLIDIIARMNPEQARFLASEIEDRLEMV